jgi:hypothetical protein
MQEKWIGKGYWYNVYDIGSWRVIKREKNVWQKINDAFQREALNPLRFIIVIYRLLGHRSVIANYYSYLAQLSEPWIIGTPKFLPGINY